MTATVVKGKPGEDNTNIQDVLDSDSVAQGETDQRTFQKETLGYQFGKICAVQCHDVVQNYGPEVEGVEDGSDATRHGRRHSHLGDR